MAYTTIDQLTPDPSTGSIVRGDGLYLRDNTFFYAEDIKKVVAQDPNATLAQLQMIPVLFERSDGDENHNQHEVTVLALAKDPIDGAPLTALQWHDVVAMAWPPYYKQNTVAVTDSQPGSAYKGQRYLGSPNYNTGMKINR